MLPDHHDLEPPGGSAAQPDLRAGTQAEVRDALWMLTKQWQMGEFRGSDAGSPVFARLLMQNNAAHQVSAGRRQAGSFRSGDSARNQGRAPAGSVTSSGQNPVARRASGHGAAVGLADRRSLPHDYRVELTSRPIRSPRPDPTQNSNVDVCAHPEACDTFQAMATRAMDGGAFYEYLPPIRRTTVRRGVAGINPLDDA